MSIRRLAVLVTLAAAALFGPPAVAQFDPPGVVLPAPPDISLPGESKVDRDSMGYWLYLNGEKTPAITGMVYQPVPEGRHIRDYAGHLSDLYEALRDPADGGLGHGRRLASLGVEAIRAYELPVYDYGSSPEDIQRIKETFRWLYAQYGIRVLIGHWAGLHSHVDLSTGFGQMDVCADAWDLADTYCEEPWVLGWQIGNENNYHTVGGRLSAEINLSLPQYYAFMDRVAGAVRDRLAAHEVSQIVALGQGDLTPEEARLIAGMANIDVVSINTYRPPQGPGSIEEVIGLAGKLIPHPVLFGEIGWPAGSGEAEERQSEYLQQVQAVIYAHAAGRVGRGNVVGAFVHEATDEAWKAGERGNPQDAHYGVFGKIAEGTLRGQIADRQRFGQTMPRTDDSGDLLRAAWARLDAHDYGYAMGYAGRTIDLYQETAQQQSEKVAAGGRTPGDAGDQGCWALDSVGAAHFLIGRAWYEMNDKARAQAEFDILRRDYPAARIRDREQRSWSLARAVRRLFPDLSAPYFQADAWTTAAFTLVCLLLIFSLEVVLAARRSAASMQAGIRRALGRPRPSATLPAESVPVLSAWDRVGLLVLIGAQMGLLFWFMAWWFHPVRLEFHIVSPTLYWALSAAAGFDGAFHLYVLHVLASMRRPLHLAPEPGLRVAVVTTYVAGEPIDLMERTLAAMVAVRYPHHTWVLDEADSQELRDLSVRLGVAHFTRKGIAAYNTPDGRFQERTKGGNLNAWLDAHGGKYAFVTFVDPDHAPAPEFLDRVLGHFRRLWVGFVQAPQVYGNQSDGLVARGASEQGIYFHGPMQMGLYGLGRCMVNGSHCTFRTAALEQIGGYAVHDADDVLTGVRLQAKGWRGVFVPEVVAVGLGPTTWETYFQQQFRWARSMFDLVLHRSRREFHGLPWRHRLGHAVLSSWYLVTAKQTLLLLLPLAAIAINAAPVNTALPEFLRFYVPFILLRYLLLTLWSRRFLRDARRPPALCFCGGLVTVAAWPAYVWALVRALIPSRVGPRVTTPKSPAGRRGSLRPFIPHAATIAASATAIAYSFVSGSYVWPTQGMRIFLAVIIVWHILVLLVALRPLRPSAT
jgi:cellulose synthase/poly-beta-1,6-N-acetylglucosamine synthase-like glycosyltransferase